MPKVPDIPISGVNTDELKQPSDPGLLARVASLFQDPRVFQKDSVSELNTAQGEIPTTQFAQTVLGEKNGIVSEFLSGFRDQAKRADLYRQYQDMERTFPELSAGLDMYADYTVSGGGTEKSASFEVETDDRLFKDELRKIERRLGIKEIIWSIARGMIRDGDEFAELIVDGAGLAKLRVLPKNEIFRNEDSIGNLKSGEAFIQRRGEKKILFDEWQLIHWRLRVDQSDPYGRSVMWSSRRLARELALSEDALTIARLSRAHQRLKYVVDVGETTDASEVSEILANARLKNRRIRVMNENSGRLSLRNNPLRTEEDIFIARRPGGSADVSVIQGDKSILSIPDILHKYDRMFAAMKISKAWFGLTGPNIRSVVGEQGRNFMRTVRRIRTDLKIGLTKLYLAGLRIQGVDTQRLLDLDLNFKFPMMSHADDELRYKLDTLKITIAKGHRELGTMSRQDILVNIFGINKHEAEELLINANKEPAPSVPALAPMPQGQKSNGSSTPFENLGLSDINKDHLQTAVNDAINRDPTILNLVDSVSELIDHIQTYA